VKNRPNFDPLIVHIADKEDVFKYSEDVDKDIKLLIDNFWPGPLTIVLKKNDIIPSIVTAGLDTVALRMPNNSIALKLIKYSGVPIAAPSANPFGYISPTSAFQVAEKLYNKVDIILDGGKCLFGLESTVLLFKDGEFFLLRPGALELEKIENVLKRSVKIYDGNSFLSPGLLQKHYSPNKKSILIVPVINDDGIDYEMTIKKLYDSVKEFNSKEIFLLLPSQDFVVDIDMFGKVDYFSEKYNLRIIASNLFEKLYLADKSDLNLIVIVGIEDKQLGMSIMNRLKKSCQIKF
jgi:L-threonylcarbamoyladenylate synthase